MRGLSASRVENVLAKLPVAFSDCEAAQSKSAERRLRVMKRRIGGAKGGRTPDLLNAIQALSQLSYGPTGGPRRPSLGDARGGSYRQFAQPAQVEIRAAAREKTGQAPGAEKEKSAGLPRARFRQFCTQAISCRRRLC